MSSVAPPVEEKRLGQLLGGPEGFRLFLEKRGPIFVKIGQFLALRPDLIPRRYCDELMDLFDQVPPFSWSEARQIIKEDLGAEPAELFAYIDPRPISAGSLAQVHLAHLDDGARVAVKVLRPNIRKRINRDLRRARLLARFLQLSRAIVIVSPQEVIEELSQWLMQETDLERELSNVTRLYGLTADNPVQVIPKPYPELSGPRVLTTEFVKGVAVSKLLARGAEDGNDRSVAAEERAEQLDIDRDLLARSLMTACLTQIFRYSFFHADLHPGNLIVLPGDRIGFVDFGLCDHLDETLRKRQMQFLGGLYRGDTERVFRVLTEILIITPDSDVKGFRRDYLEETRMWVARKEGDLSFTNEAYSSPLATYMIGVLRAARRHRLQIPTRILSIYRALLTAESVSQQLGSDVELNSVGRDFFEKLQIDEAVSSLQLRNVESALLSYLALWRDSPGQLNQILADLSDSRFVLKVDVSEGSDLAHLRNRRTRAILFSILTVGMSVLVALNSFRQVVDGWVSWLLVSLLVVLYVLTFLEVRKLK